MQKGYAKQFFPGLFAKRQKGQLFSLDFIISMVAVTAAIALLIHSIEVNAYSQKEQQLHDELKQVAETAADLLVSNPTIVCELIDNKDNEKHIAYLENCIPKINKEKIDGEDLRISKQKMGIPDEFKCKIELQTKEGKELKTADCEKGPSQDIGNIYSITRTIVLYFKESNKKIVPKKELEICMKNASENASERCDLIEDTITLWVWKE